jgi:hypothetical protein
VTTAQSRLDESRRSALIETDTSAVNQKKSAKQKAPAVRKGATSAEQKKARKPVGEKKGGFCC